MNNKESAQERIQKRYIDNLRKEDIYFKVMLKLSCISSSTKIHLKMHGMPAREYLGPETSSFWIQWDFGRELVAMLALHCREYGLNAEKSHFWPLLSKHFQQYYNEAYEFEKKVCIKSDDFDELQSAICRNNIIIIDDYRLSPNEYEEVTGPYGEDAYLRKWQLKGGNLDVKFHVDDNTLANEVFNIINS